MFQTGDRVVIKEWDDMVREFELAGSGNIRVGEAYFVTEMKPLCGESGTVKMLGPEYGDGELELHIKLDNPEIQSFIDSWYINELMVVREELEEIDHECDDSFMSFLLGDGYVQNR